MARDPLSDSLQISNLSVLALHSKDSLYATKSGKIKSESKWNVIGRIIHWFKDPKGQRLNNAVNDLLNKLETLSDVPGSKFNISVEEDGKERTIEVKSLMTELIDHKIISETFRERINKFG